MDDSVQWTIFFAAVATSETALSRLCNYLVGALPYKNYYRTSCDHWTGGEAFESLPLLSIVTRALQSRQLEFVGPTDWSMGTQLCKLSHTSAMRAYRRESASHSFVDNVSLRLSTLDALKKLDRIK